MARKIKRLLYLFSGILAGVFLSLSSSLSASAVSFSEFAVYATGMRFVYYLSGNSTAYQGNLLTFPTTGTSMLNTSIGANQRFTDIKFIIPSVSGRGIQAQRIQVSFELYIAKATTTYGTKTPLPVCPTIGSGANTVSISDVTCDIIPSESNNTQISFFTITYSGYAYEGLGNNTEIMFQGPWLVNNDTDSSYTVSISRPLISFSTNYASITSDNVYEILKTLKEGLEVNIENSQLATSDKQDQIDTSINDASDQAHKDSQAQLNYQKQQAEKEEQQRKEDEEKANQTGSDSQDKSDASQSEVDAGSASLFTVINGVKDTILQGSNTGNCKISGDFGFFNAGDIDICTGGSKIRPITSVVGTVMLIFFMFTSALTLLARFKELYFKFIGSS